MDRVVATQAPLELVQTDNGYCLRLSNRHGESWYWNPASSSWSASPRTYPSREEATAGFSAWRADATAGDEAGHEPVGRPHMRVFPPERRASARHPCGKDVPVHVIARTSGGSRWACLVNLSREGAGLLLSCRLEPGTRVELRLSSRQRDYQRKLSGRVVRSRSEAGNWFAGCAFDDALAEHEVYAVGA